jgi:hypothetical protein
MVSYAKMIPINLPWSLKFGQQFNKMGRGTKNIIKKDRMACNIKSSDETHLNSLSYNIH